MIRYLQSQRTAVFCDGCEGAAEHPPAKDIHDGGVLSVKVDVAEKERLSQLLNPTQQNHRQNH